MRKKRKKRRRRRKSRLRRISKPCTLGKTSLDTNHGSADEKEEEDDFFDLAEDLTVPPDAWPISARLTNMT